MGKNIEFSKFRPVEISVVLPNFLVTTSMYFLPSPKKFRFKKIFSLISRGKCENRLLERQKDVSFKLKLREKSAVQFQKTVKNGVAL